MVTPETIKKEGCMLLDTNFQINMTGIVLPVSTASKPMRGTLTIMSEDTNGEDFSVITDMIMRQPEATPAGAYKVKVQIYCSDTDKLRVLPRRYGLDVIAHVAGVMDSEDFRLEWQ